MRYFVALSQVQPNPKFKATCANSIGFRPSLQCRAAQTVNFVWPKQTEFKGMTLMKTFWTSSFGMMTDKFGVPWMVNVAMPKA